MTKTVREAIRIAKSCGVYCVTINYRGKHVQMLTEFGPVTFATTPSDQRWEQNLRAFIRRMVRSAVNDN